jgi:hypothetical protein
MCKVKYLVKCIISNHCISEAFTAEFIFVQNYSNVNGILMISGTMVTFEKGSNHIVSIHVMLSRSPCILSDFFSFDPCTKRCPS